MLASRSRILATKSRSFADDSNDMEFESAPPTKGDRINTQQITQDYDRDMAWLEDAKLPLNRTNLFTSSQNQSDFIVSDQARSLSAKRARLAKETEQDDLPGTSKSQNSSQPLKLRPPPTSLNMDSFLSSSTSFDNRKLRADLDRAKRWIKQAEESYEELASLRYTAAEKQLVNIREKAKLRFESSEKLIKSLQETQQQLEANLASTREELGLYRVKAKELKKENEMLSANSGSQTESIEASELELFNKWKMSRNTGEIDEVKQVAAERDELRKQLRAMTEVMRSHSHEMELDKARKREEHKSFFAGAPSSTDSTKNDKSELYEDLTGLLLTDVKRTADSIVYNCLQTGRNGTLHFKLSQNNDQPNELHYQPMLDKQRDADLIMRLPEYLTTEIEFTRDKANSFFWRLLTFLQSSDKKDHAGK
ncbi:hypothetical protein INT43_007514 [Umbelopsis isabellina]|uniref:Monopolin complex subunit Csm1/Pcs1 C-terminal domain-containing protein n=1 Tax=Mortierella isabellina TaxID=91625 RepID=A0A8H7PYI3_MORIS|nr:hypothetical protein INT43_007514 [Umbelopsis isabellina]